jgi:hypothetical protein
MNISQRTWDQYAAHVIEYLRILYPNVHRACAIVSDDEGLFAIIFGNEDPAGDHIRLGEEVSAIRDSLQGMAVHDLGFGQSRDGNSWALISRSEQGVCKTEVGKRFQTELLRAQAEEAVLLAKAAVQ